MQFDFGFRIDIDAEVGSGHFFRCLAITEKIINKKDRVIFIVNNKQGIESHLDGRNIPFHVLKSKNELGKINECKKIVKNISKLIIDLPKYNEMYSELLQNYCKTIIIDDIGNKKIKSNILFNGSIVSKFQNYSIEKNMTKYYFGPKYMILRNKFKILRKKITVKEKIQKILLIFGGSDDCHITRKIIPYFFNKKYDITIVLGPSYKDESKLTKIIPKNKNIKIIKNEENIARLFSEQDLVISSSGITAYELACLGIPSIFIPTDKYQLETAITMEKNGFGMNCGFWDENFHNLDKKILMISKKSVRKKMYLSGREIVDGNGLSRIVKKIYEF